MLRFRRLQSPQTFAALHGSIHNHVNAGRHLTNRRIFKECRNAARAEWRCLRAA